MINELLDLARIESGEMRLEYLPFELSHVLDEVHGIVHPLALAKGLELQFDAGSTQPLQLRGDALRLKQILLNLLGNAVKFTPSGSVTLRVRETGRSATVLTLCLQVRDTGIGIAPEVQPRIFDAFTQADSFTTRRFGGTGLGLSIVRRLVDMLNGTISVESQPGRGSTFSVKLPFPTA